MAAINQTFKWSPLYPISPRLEFDPVERTGDPLILVDGSCTIPGSDHSQYHVDIDLDISKLVALLIHCPDFAVQIETNSDTTPDDDFTLISGLPYQWVSSGYSANSLILTADITAGFYATGESGTDHNLYFKAWVDASLT